ncbi:MAG: hypothetical protein CMM65_00880 [Rhodospirillaceae bacterium]|jgi:hypothetical protein|nr:hypothetical protein [Rhodospirillaceae bacterium]|tara:strand:+ start:33 stop:776 length:744 start_codon:yes stop_codon:yes gene_type:complete
MKKKVFDEEYLSDFMYETEDELRSYSDSFESRARDRFIVYVDELYNMGSADEFQKMYHADKVIVKKKNRRLMDYVEITAFKDRLEIISLNDEVTEGLIKITREEKGFDDIRRDPAKNLITVVFPEMDFNQILELADATTAKQKQYERTLNSVKMQTGQQLKSGIEKEYIEQSDAVKVSKEIERIIEHYVTYSKILCVAKVLRLGRKIKPETPEDEIIFSRVDEVTWVYDDEPEDEPEEEAIEEEMVM